MTNGNDFRGVYTAIVTPFRARDRSVDYETFGRLIDENIAGGVQGIVPCGTTGESPTLTHDEHKEVIMFTVQRVNRRVKVIAGTGSNSTDEAVGLSVYAKKAGADALLLVCPYYNRPGPEGLKDYFGSVAKAVFPLPCIPYNIPKRTGVNLEPETLFDIVKDNENVVAVKEASGDSKTGNIDQIERVIHNARRPSWFRVLSGDDPLTVKIIESGGDGVVSVASNIIPAEIVSMVNNALGDEQGHLRAEAANSHLAKLFGAMFIETNPQPIKYMLSRLGKCDEVYRSPMVPLQDGNKRIVERVMREYGLLR